MLTKVIHWVPWIAFTFGMFLTFCVIYVKTESFRKALLGALFIGKTFCIVYLLAGLDRVLTTLYIINRRHPWVVYAVKITMCEAVLLSFAVTVARIYEIELKVLCR